MEGQNKKIFAPLIISGCSGVGKGTLIKHLLKKYPNLFALSVSFTTRPARPGQQHGRQYYFVSKEQFQKQIEKNSFAQYCHVHENIYGTHKQKLNQWVQKGIICILDIDLQGAQKIKKNYQKECNYLWIDAPSLQQIEKRLRGRGTQKEESIQKRMNNAKGQLQTVGNLDYYARIKNQTLEQTNKKLQEWIENKYHIKLSDY